MSVSSAAGHHITGPSIELHNLLVRNPSTSQREQFLIKRFIPHLTHLLKTQPPSDIAVLCFDSAMKSIVAKLLTANNIAHHNIEDSLANTNSQKVIVDTHDNTVSSEFTVAYVVCDSIKSTTCSDYCMLSRARTRLIVLNSDDDRARVKDALPGATISHHKP